jgi:hypothetical protein
VRKWKCGETPFNLESSPGTLPQDLIVKWARDQDPAVCIYAQGLADLPLGWQVASAVKACEVERTCVWPGGRCGFGAAPDL